MLNYISVSHLKGLEFGLSVGAGGQRDEYYAGEARERIPADEVMSRWQFPN